MNGVSPGPLRDVDESLDVEVAARGLVRPEVEGLVSFLNVSSGPVAILIDRDSRETHLAARAHDTDGNLAAIGDEDFHRSKFWQVRAYLF